MARKKQPDKKILNFQDYLEEQLKDPKIKKYYDEYGKQLEIAYKILELRKENRMSQSELAHKIGTKQSNVARMEAGRQNFTTGTLRKIASVFGYDLKVEFVK